MYLKNILALLCLFNFLDNCLVFGGNEVGLKEYSYMAQIFVQHSSGEPAFCAGTVVSKRHVLTVGSCLVKSSEGPVLASPSDVTVRLGSVVRGKEGQVFSVNNVYLHPNSNKDSMYDIAVLELEDKEFNGEISIAKLATSENTKSLADMIAGKQTCGTAGWESPDERPNLGSPDRNHDRLKAAPVGLMTWTECKKQVPSVQQDSEMCTWSPFTFAGCYNVMGDPLFCGPEKVQYGLLTRGDGCHIFDTTYVYARIDALSVFIQNAINGNVDPSV